MTAISATIFRSVSWTLITVKILQDMTELARPAAAFAVLVVAIVFVMIAVIGQVLNLFRRGAPRMTSMLGG
jgi:iron(III) transport system permease protein